MDSSKLQNSKRKQKTRIEDLSFSDIKDSLVEEIARSLTKQIDRELFDKKYATAKTVLKLVGAGVFLAASIAVPNLPLALKPFLSREDDYEAWKRFNIRYLKRTLKRLENQKLVEIGEEEGAQVVKITSVGKRKILKFAIDELKIEKPKSWDRTWRMVSYDIPKNQEGVRKVFREYLKVWRFYPFHESLFLHAYPCEKQVEFLREYLGIGEHVRIIQVYKIENDKLFRDFFDV
jgi:DNA-binding PadR family transcriptional regulator